MALYNYVTPSASTLYYGQAFSVSTNIVNNGTNGFSGDYAAAVFDNANNFYGFVQTLSGYTLPAGNAYNSDLTFSTTGLFSMLPGVLCGCFLSTNWRRMGVGGQQWWLYELTSNKCDQPE